MIRNRRKLREDISPERVNQINLKTIQLAASDIAIDVGVELAEAFVKNRYNRALFDNLAKAMHEHGVMSTSENLVQKLVQNDQQQFEALINDCSVEIAAVLENYSSKIAKFVLRTYG